MTSTKLLSLRLSFLYVSRAPHATPRHTTGKGNAITILIIIFILDLGLPPYLSPHDGSLQHVRHRHGLRMQTLAQPRPLRTNVHLPLHFHPYIRRSRRSIHSNLAPSPRSDTLLWALCPILYISPIKPIYGSHYGSGSSPNGSSSHTC